MIDKNENKNRFKEAARALDCDMTEEEFARAIKGIASVRPMTQAQVKKKAKKKKG